MVIKSYKIFDYVLAPEDKVKIEYTGPDPFRIYGMLPKMMQIVFHGRGKNIFERQFKWDITSDPREFFFYLMYGDQKFDRFTGFEIKIRSFGMQPSDPNNPNGKIYLEIKGEITTEYKFESKWEQVIGMPFVWLYHRMIYQNTRRRYMQILREQIYKLTDDIRSELGIVEAGYETPELTGAGVKTGE